MSMRVIVIAGATGKQGGATARALAGKGFRLRAMTRKPDSDAARALAAEGIEIARADLDDPASIEAALDGAWGVYAVQNTWEAGVEKEEAQGKLFATIARRLGVQRFVYASVASAPRQTGIPHFDNKARVEDTVRALDFPSYAIVRPVFFMENLVSPWFLNGDTVYAALDPATVLQMVAVHDIGQYGALAFTDADRLPAWEVDIAGDAVTMPQAAAALSAGMGRSIAFVSLPVAEVRKQSEDLALMFEWFERVGYDADIPGNARTYGVTPTTLSAWAGGLSSQ